ncbi:hypothetical protein COV81_04135 [Candidatus Peregrinibacteria bacterium CG11_big_fil_rev_8_21_14_0_20_41_10]|nr:MAG: hypothetical protein COV81_04135 [Candidatus Peregrinibacteria bacterium CG11_big_fil_rev_8_21_14_0_20_41_10]PIZ77530.1 MAG: hypothetical protein COY06_00545 [Candidatus Peregrinibacteria bacterium CG_4_10_14_0_2_um_filter_41_8]PJC37939.1 MAG: hypothetical protein CO045_02900 [Candidatus Peregrinibacteria bacterium CG_4_9_14_0_2_um_filter_41_14]
MSRYCFLNGKIILESEAKISVFDEGFIYGYGIYETMRTYKKRLINWDSHFERLTHSLNATNLELPYTKPQLLNFINQLIKKNTETEYRIRLTISAGFNQQPTTLISVQPLQLPTLQQYQNGVPVITTLLSRPLPSIKSTNLLAQKLLWQEMQTKQAFEAIFVDPNGNVLEGSRSNLLIIKDQKIYTPKRDILKGTTSRLINQFSDQLNIPFTAKSLTLKDLLKADEAFITNALIGIVPINQVDTHKIPTGPITLQLQTAYNHYLDQIPHA